MPRFALLSAAPSFAGVANAGIPGAPAGNPIAGLPWGVFADGRADPVYGAWQAARGARRALLGRIATRPHTPWYGAFNRDAAAAARNLIRRTTHGRSGVMAQATVFRLVPWEGRACQRLPSPGERAGYRSWISSFARGIGTARIMIILQPDMPFWLCVPGHSRVPLDLVAYAARTFAALPHATVYIDGGAADYESAHDAARILRMSGVGAVRGFALNATHYDSTERQVLFGQKVVRLLAGAGIPGRHFVINTVANGRPFTHQRYHGGDFDNAGVCRGRSSRRCVTLGIPPTTDVANRRWGLSPHAQRVAAQLVDGYVWISRNWLIRQSNPFSLARALGMAGTTPF